MEDMELNSCFVECLSARVCGFAWKVLLRPQHGCRCSDKEKSVWICILSFAGIPNTACGHTYHGSFAESVFDTPATMILFVRMAVLRLQHGIGCNDREGIGMIFHTKHFVYTYIDMLIDSPGHGHAKMGSPRMIAVATK